jgi:outer membrane protein assembly factor BamB
VSSSTCHENYTYGSNGSQTGNSKTCSFPATISGIGTKTVSEALVVGPMDNCGSYSVTTLKISIPGVADCCLGCDAICPLDKDNDHDGYTGRQGDCNDNDPSITPASRLCTPPILIAGGDIVSSPAIASDGTIYVGSYDQYLYAISPGGTLKWKYATGAAVGASPAIGSDGTIFVPSNGYLHAVAPDGTARWTCQVGGMIDASPAIGSDDVVYLASRNTSVLAISPNGTLGWSYKTSAPMTSSPSIDLNGTIYAGDWNGIVYALNPDGTLKWQWRDATHVGTVDSSPAIGSDGTIYVAGGTAVVALSADGTVKWKYQTSVAFAGSSPAIGTDGTIYVGSRDGGLYAIGADGTFKWAYPTRGGVDSSPAIGADGTIYVGSNYKSGQDSYLYVLLPNGGLKWEFNPHPSKVWSITSSPAIGPDGVIYFGTTGGYLYAFGDNCGGPADSPWPMFRRNAKRTGNVASR